jgi:transcriptional regulator with XRE-family HTH domain
MDLSAKIGRRLREHRQARSLSLSGLSERTQSLSKSRISNYEQGIRRMGIEEAQILAEALGGVTASFLLCLDDAQPLSPAEQTLVDHYRHATERGRNTILRAAEAQAVGRGNPTKSS